MHLSPDRRKAELAEHGIERTHTCCLLDIKIMRNGGIVTCAAHCKLGLVRTGEVESSFLGCLILYELGGYRPGRSRDTSEVNVGQNFSRESGIE